MCLLFRRFTAIILIVDYYTVCIRVNATTNHHKLSCSNNINLLSYSSSGQRSYMSLAGIKSGCQQAEFLSGGTVEQPVSLLIWVLLANFSSSWLCDCDLHCLANWQLRAISRFQKLPYSLSHDTFPLSSKPATIRQAPLMFCISVPFSLLASVLSILLSSFPFLRIHVIIMVPP